MMKERQRRQNLGKDGEIQIDSNKVKFDGFWSNFWLNLEMLDSFVLQRDVKHQSTLVKVMLETSVKREVLD